MTGTLTERPSNLRRAPKPASDETRAPSTPRILRPRRSPPRRTGTLPLGALPPRKPLGGSWWPGTHLLRRLPAFRPRIRRRSTVVKRPSSWPRGCRRQSRNLSPMSPRSWAPPIGGCCKPRCSSTGGAATSRPGSHVARGNSPVRERDRTLGRGPPEPHPGSTRPQCCALHAHPRPPRHAAPWAVDVEDPESSGTPTGEDLRERRLAGNPVRAWKRPCRVSAAGARGVRSGLEDGATSGVRGPGVRCPGASRLAA
jgi:hypothetical protein